MKVLEFNFCGGKLCLSVIATDFDVFDLQCLCFVFFLFSVVELANHYLSCLSCSTYFYLFCDDDDDESMKMKFNANLLNVNVFFVFFFWGLYMRVYYIRVIMTEIY